MEGTNVRRREVLLGGLALAGSPVFARGAFSPAITRYEEASGGHIGFHAENLRTGRKLAWRADERFVMCSTFKASLAALILQRVARNQDRLDDRIAYGPSDIQDWYAPVAKANLPQGFMTVAEMCAAAVQHSDNTCANLLLARVGGPGAVTAFWRGMGDLTSRLDDPEPYLNRTPLGGIRNTTTPRAMAGTLGKLAVGSVLPPGARTMFRTWLIGSRTGGDRLRSGLPASWITGDKTGNNGKDAAGDIAITWMPPDTPLVMAAYTRGGSPTAEQLHAVFRAIARSAADSLSAHHLSQAES